MEDYLQLVNHEYKRWQEDKESLWAPQSQRPPPFSVSQLSLIEIRCATPRCTFYVSVDTQPHCHECFEKRQASCKPEAISTSNQASSSDTESRARLGRSVLPSPRSAPPTAPSLSLYSETHAMKCKTPGCLFTLSVEHDGLCERCFTARQNRSAANRPPQCPSHGWWASSSRSERRKGRENVKGNTERCVMCHRRSLGYLTVLCPPCMQRPAISEKGNSQQQEPRTETMHWETERAGTAGHTWRTPAARQCKLSVLPILWNAREAGILHYMYLDYQTNHRKCSCSAFTQYFLYNFKCISWNISTSNCNGCPNLVLEGQCFAEFSSNFLQLTCLEVSRKTLIRCSRASCVNLGLKKKKVCTLLTQWLKN